MVAAAVGWDGMVVVAFIVVILGGLIAVVYLPRGHKPNGGWLKELPRQGKRISGALPGVLHGSPKLWGLLGGGGGELHTVAASNFAAARPRRWVIFGLVET